MSTVLIVKCGTTDPPVVATDGDYDDWFRQRLARHGLTWQLVAPFAGEGLPSTPAVQGILVTGSPLSVRDEAPWMAATARWLLAQDAAGVPVLGVCFGHQLLGEALGGRVELGSAGRELGTVAVDLTAAGRADPLFAGLGRAPRFQATHGDVLVQPPTAAGVRRLAGNAHTEWQAFAQGPRLRAVQFHPELAGITLRRLLSGRGQVADVDADSHGAALLDNWVRHYLPPAGP